MGLLSKALEIRSVTNMNEKIKWTGPEAAIALSTLVSFADDDPSDVEGAIMRKYYRYEDAASFEKKMKQSGFSYPGDIKKMEPAFIEALQAEDIQFRRRTLAVAYLLAMADGTIDQEEMRLLSYYGEKLEVSLGEARSFADHQLKELDEVSGYHDVLDYKQRNDIDFTDTEAALALAMMTAFADDDPTEEEVAVIRDFFNQEEVAAFQKKVEKAGYDFPREIGLVKPFILQAFLKCDRNTQLKYLAIAYKTALADGSFDPEEIELLREVSSHFFIGLGEIEDFFKAVPEPV